MPRHCCDEHSPVTMGPIEGAAPGGTREERGRRLPMRRPYERRRLGGARTINVRLWRKADIDLDAGHVRFQG